MSKHVVIERHKLNGWANGKGLSGSDWRAFAESLPAGEFSTTLLFVADAIDEADGTGWYAPKQVDPDEVLRIVQEEFGVSK